MADQSPSQGDSKDAEVVTLVMDGGTAYVMVMILGMTIANAEKSNIPGAPREVLIYAHDQLAGQLGIKPYDNAPYAMPERQGRHPNGA